MSFYPVATAGVPPVYITHASSATVLLSGQTARVDVSGGVPPSITAPPSPADAATIGAANTGGDFATTPCVITAGAGQTIEDPNTPGTFGSTATLLVTGAHVQWAYELALTRWKVSASFYPMAPAGLIQSPPNADLLFQAGLYTGSSLDHRNLIVNFGRGNPSHSNQGSALVRQDPEGILLDEHATSPGSGDVHNNTHSFIHSGADFGRTYDVAVVHSTRGGENFIARAGSALGIGIEGLTGSAYMFRVYDDTNNRPALQMKIQGTADSVSFHAAPAATQDNAIQLALASAPTGNPAAGALWCWHDGTSFTWSNSSGATVLRSRPVTSGAGNTITIGGSAGHTPGTNAAGATTVDLGALVSGVSAQFDLQAPLGTTILGVAQTAASQTTISAGANAVNFTTIGGLQFTAPTVSVIATAGGYFNPQAPTMYFDVATQLNIRSAGGATTPFVFNTVNGHLNLATTPTTTSAPSAGAAGALPATPAGYAELEIAGVTRHVAYY